jgi:hypothetical protein
VRGTGSLNDHQQDVLTTAYRRDIAGGDVEDLGEAVRHGVDATEALLAVLGRGDRRQRLVVELIEAGEVSHALRLATCGRRSVQLRCPDGLAGGCGHEENYVPINCDSRLCPDCGKRRQGQVAGQYREVLEGWRHPTMLRLSLPERVDVEDLEGAVDALRGAFGRLRRRVIPTSGRHQGKRWVWSSDGGAPADHNWKAALLAAGRHDLARRWQKRYVEQGRGIPMDELLRAGLYGIDAKQGADGTVNVHVHVLADVPYIPQAALASVWDDLTGAPVVDVRRVEERGSADRESALMETVGYAAKPPEYETFDAAVEYATALKGSKLIQPFGELYGNTPDVEAELRCAGCEQSPAWWDYMGTVNDRIETMETNWDDPTRGENDPPGDD